ncbi:hypothetical protein KDAU_53460 [Dictyobacter aurantiacus]|uniref:Uncharacterized protein n=1 Tax=Dictyobacter aurantiacus TaxID=1936993 RepID=A0A401ZMB4_9CHLR|nr:hypothetical protein KDAU_53460 [Dictyobacter aurantiacus]
MTRDMAAGLYQADSRHEIFVSLNKEILGGWLIKACERLGKARIGPLTRNFVLLALYNHLRVGKCIMIAGMVGIKVAADDVVYVRREEPQAG